MGLRRWARRQERLAPPAGTTDPVPDVVLWADSFTDGFASGSGRAAVALLESAGCGWAW